MNKVNTSAATRYLADRLISHLDNIKISADIDELAVVSLQALECSFIAEDIGVMTRKEWSDYDAKRMAARHQRASELFQLQLKARESVGEK